MNKEAYENLCHVEAQPTCLSISDISDPHISRTLIYGYHCDGAGTIHTYLEDGVIHVLTYNHDQLVINHLQGTSVEIQAMLPGKRAYPECCDYSACAVIQARGFHISFTTFDEKREAATFYGQRLETLTPTAEWILQLRETHSTLQKNLFEMLCDDEVLDAIDGGQYMYPEMDQHRKVADKEAMELGEPIRQALLCVMGQIQYLEDWNNAKTVEYHEHRAKILELAANTLVGFGPETKLASTTELLDSFEAQVMARGLALNAA
jgi:hypothetical protein